MESNWHELTSEAALQRLESNPTTGLSAVEAAERRARHGANELVERAGRSVWRMVWNQLRGAMVALLAVAAVVSLALGEPRDTLAIVVIVLLNAALGVVQEYRAERAMAALKQLEVARVKVVRDGELARFPAPELVPGDVIVLEAGDRVAADVRLLEAVDLRIHEAALTGESESVLKNGETCFDAGVPLGDRLNMAFMGTLVVNGRGRALVTATGMTTELGRVADLLQTVDKHASPLERRLSQLGRGLAIVAVGIVAAVVILGWLRGEPAHLLILTGLSLAVAAVPEGLPAVATVALALGARRMLARRALIRRLPAVETLGSVTVICTDKTGTLTRNRMTVAALHTLDASWEMVEGEPPALADALPFWSPLFSAMALCNDATPSASTDVASAEAESSPEVLGEPTEVALVEAAARHGWDKIVLDARLPRRAEAPFDSARKRMTTIHELSDHTTRDRADDAWLAWSRHETASFVAITKGAVDVLLERVDRVWDGQSARVMTTADRARIETIHDELASRGMRLLGFAFRPLEALPMEAVEQVENGMVFVGLAGLMDPPRRDAERAIRRCRGAGIRPVMITGDHPLTGHAIAEALGISAHRTGLEGRQVEQMTDDALATAVEDVAVFARVAPHHKLRIVQAFQARGHIVAMTGDGVNDAPALRQADIGVAMGISGTDVAKEAAEMVLLDDHFATIVDAVEEGRTIYANVRKFVRYILASNVGEVWVMLVAPILGMPLPLLPLQILWINLVTDGLPGMALGLEKGDGRLMRHPPYPPGESIFRRGLGRDVVWIGVLIGSLALAVGFSRWRGVRDATLDWRTMLFTVLTLSQLGIALASRSRTSGRWTRHGNPLLPAAIGITCCVQMAALYWPPLATVLGVGPLALGDLALCVVISAVPMVALEAKSRWTARAHPIAR